MSAWQYIVHRITDSVQYSAMLATRCDEIKRNRCSEHNMICCCLMPEPWLQLQKTMDPCVPFIHLLHHCILIHHVSYFGRLHGKGGRYAIIIAGSKPIGKTQTSSTVLLGSLACKEQLHQLCQDSPGLRRICCSALACSSYTSTPFLMKIINDTSCRQLQYVKSAIIIAQLDKLTRHDQLGHQGGDGIDQVCPFQKSPLQYTGLCSPPLPSPPTPPCTPPPATTPSCCNH